MSSAHPHPQGFNGAYPANTTSLDDGAARETDDIDEIIRMAEAGIRPPKKIEAQQAPSQQPEPAPAPEPIAVPSAAPEPSEKKSKKDKDKNMKMIYSDNEVSPEEKMARMPRYAFAPVGKDDTELVDAATQPGMAGVVDE